VAGFERTLDELRRGRGRTLVRHQIEETIDEYLSKVSIEDKQLLFQSVNKAGTALSGCALNRYHAWAAIRKRENWKDPLTDKWLRTCTIITGEPNELVA
jgi:hypothetical protein